MSITAETFELEHFDKLVRGISVAREAYDRALNGLHHASNESFDLRLHLESCERELAESPSIDQWNKLIEFIGDVERDLRSAEELFAYVREEGWTTAK